MTPVSSVRAIAALGRPIVAGLFVASLLLSIVSWYTTWQGMMLYLAPWFALLASLGVQTALLLVAWLVGVIRNNRAILVGVYVITAVVSIAFSYVALYTWFAGKERPATVQRKLYDRLNDLAGKSEGVLASAAAEGQAHLLALEEMTVAEREHGYISKAGDSDPYLARIREAVAREAQSYREGYREGVGAGVRYTAFERYAKLARQSRQEVDEARRRLAAFRTGLRPTDPTEKQLREFHAATGSVPWTEVEEVLHNGPVERPQAPAYEEFTDRTESGQEELLLAFRELFMAPTPRHAFAFALAAFIDIIVFLVAFASGPYFFGAPEERWCRAAAALDGTHDECMVRDFMRKLAPNERGLPHVAASQLTAGEQQLCLLLNAKGLAAAEQVEGRLVYILEEGIHEQLLESLAARSVRLHVRTPQPAAQA